MVDLEPERLDAVFHALADPTRRGMLRSLAAQPCSVSELAAPYRMSLAAASKHIKALERAGLVHRTVKGRTHLCALDAARLGSAHDWLAFYRRFWTDQFDALDVLLKPEHPASDSAKGSTE